MVNKWLLMMLACLLVSGAAAQGSHLTGYLQDIQYDVHAHKGRLFREMSANKCPELRTGIEYIGNKFE